MADFTGSSNGGLSLLLRINRTSQQADREYYKIELWLNKYSATWDSDGATWSIAATNAQTRSGHYTVSTGSTRVKLGEYTSYWLRNYGSSRKITVTGSSGDIAYKSIASVTGSFTVAARPYSAPAAPSGVSAVRVSDTQVKVQATASASTAAPVSSVIVQRSTDGAGYVQVASLSGAGGKTWTDTGVAAGHYYRYRVYATGRGGSSPVVYSSYVYMTPSAPSGVSAVKNSSQDVVVSWTNTARGEYQTRLYEGESPIGTVGKGTTSFTVVSPSATVAHTYSVAHTAGGLESVRVSSNQVQLAAAPYAPTNLAPNGQYAAAGQSLQLSWRHNPADSSAQSKAEIQYAVNTATPQWSAPISRTGEEESTSLFFSSVTSFLWRVRTWGQAADKPSPWSTPASFTVVYPPTVTWTTPIADATITTATLTVSGAISGGNGSIEVVVTDTSARNTQVFQQTVPATPSFTATVGGLENSHTYVIAVRPFRKVWGGSVSRTVKVAYAAPATPSLTARWDPDTGSTQLSIMAGNAEGTAETVSLSVQRQSETGEWETIATGLPVQTDLTDYAPPLSGVLGYRVVAVSTLDTTEVSDETTVQAVSDGVFINWGAGGSRCVKLAWNITAETQEKALTRNEYVFAGNTLPTLIQGMAVRAETRISALLGALRWAPNVEETMRALTEAAMTATPVIVRRPDYRPLSGYLEASAPKDTDGVYTVSFTHYEAL